MRRLDVIIEHGVDENGNTIRFGVTIDGARNPTLLAARLNKLLAACALAIAGLLTQAVAFIDWLL